MHKIGDKVLVIYPNSCLTLGGTVLMVIAVMGKPIVYSVLMGTNTHHLFEESLVK